MEVLEESLRIRVATSSDCLEIPPLYGQGGAYGLYARLQARRDAGCHALRAKQDVGDDAAFVKPRSGHECNTGTRDKASRNLQ